MDNTYSKIDQEPPKSLREEPLQLIDPIKYEKECMNALDDTKINLIKDSKEKLKNFLVSDQKELTILIDLPEHKISLINELLPIIDKCDQYIDIELYNSDEICAPRFIKKLFNIKDKLVFQKKDKDCYLSIVNLLLKNNIEYNKKAKVKSPCILFKANLVYYSGRGLRNYLKIVSFRNNLNKCLKDTGYHLTSKIEFFTLNTHFVFTLQICTGKHEHKDNEYNWKSGLLTEYFKKTLGVHELH